MRPADWYPAPGMRFLLPAIDEWPATVAEVMENGLNSLCRCDSCPCFFVAIDGLAGQFSASELRVMAFALDNEVTESGPEPVRMPSGFHGYLQEGDAVQGAML